MTDLGRAGVILRFPLIQPLSRCRTTSTMLIQVPCLCEVGSSSKYDSQRNCMLAKRQSHQSRLRLQHAGHAQLIWRKTHDPTLLYRQTFPHSNFLSASSYFCSSRQTSSGYHYGNQHNTSILSGTSLALSSPQTSRHKAGALYAVHSELLRHAAADKCPGKALKGGRVQ